MSRYGLFKETIRKFLQALRKQQPDVYLNIKGQLSQDYLEKEFDLTEKDKDLAHRSISLKRSEKTDKIIANFEPDVCRACAEAHNAAL